MFLFLDIEAGLLFATEVLRPGGAYVAKVLAGGADNQLVAEMKRLYGHHKYVADIRLNTASNDEPAIEFIMRKQSPLDQRRLGLPARFRRVKTRLVPANDTTI